MVVLRILFGAVLATALIVAFYFMLLIVYGDSEKIKNKIGKRWYWIIYAIIISLMVFAKTFSKSHGG